MVRSLCQVAAGLALACGATAQPIVETWAVAGGDDTVAVSAAALSGWYATGDSFEDTVEIRDIDQGLIGAIGRAELAAMAPWMSLAGGPDGPSGLAFSDSGRLLFILVHDASVAGDGQPSDVVLKYDTGTASLTRFARLELFDRDDQWPHLAGAHFKGRLYIGTAVGGVAVYRAERNDDSGTLLGASPVPGNGPVRGLAVDRLNGFLFAASDTGIYRANLASWPLTWTLVGSIANLRALAFSDHFGGVGQDGLFALEAAPGLHRVHRIPTRQALGIDAFAPIDYLSGWDEWHDLCATAEGRLIAGADEDAVIVSDASDARLRYDSWLRDEFEQVVCFGKGLISPDGEPWGWVLDGDVDAGLNRFHPATPDAAAWVVLLLIASDEITGDPSARGQVRDVLVRYAGLAADGIGPSITTDGFMRHWIDPFTGNAMNGWPTEYATMSTMKIVLAADRARAYYAGDSEIRSAASKIICQVANHDAFIHPDSDGLYLVAWPSGGPDFNSLSHAFHEGIIFVEQAAKFGGEVSQTAYGHWLDRGRWPAAAFLTGRPITGDTPGHFQASFVSLYELLVQEGFRSSAAWREQISNVRSSNGAWSDDNGPRYNTVFSAGTTKAAWGGYHADNLGDHPGNVATFTSLMALAGSGAHGDAVGAYNAYRRGARQTFEAGASILYRRSDVDRAYEPDSAGLPDVALGALGLAELLRPGLLDGMLARPYDGCGCQADCDGTGQLNVFDFLCYSNEFSEDSLYADFDGNGTLNVFDFLAFQNRFAEGCP